MFRADLDEELSGATIVIDPALQTGVTYDHWGLPSASGTISIAVGEHEWLVTISRMTGVAEVTKE